MKDRARSDIWEKLGFAWTGDEFRKMFVCEDFRSLVTVKPVGEASFDVSCANPDSSTGYTGLVDGADLSTSLAFVIGAANQVVHYAGWLANEELTFEDDGTAIHDPFSSNHAHSDWVGQVDEARHAWVLQDPATTYGERYVVWRNRMLELAEQGRLPALERAAAPAP